MFGFGRLKRIKESIKKYLEFCKNEPYFTGISFSQNYEDLIVNLLCENKKSLFYVDIGAHHPIRFSNTYAMYKNNGGGG